jgi:hypothetical protein
VIGGGGGGDIMKKSNSDSFLFETLLESNTPTQFWLITHPVGESILAGDVMGTGGRRRGPTRRNDSILCAYTMVIQEG